MRGEDDFLAAIDCRFPYADAKRVAALIDEACRISPNAVFMVVHELARPPVGAPVTRAACLSFLDLLATRFEHPLRDLVLDAARRLLRRRPLSLPEGRAALTSVAEHAGQWNALGIVWFACAPRAAAALQRAERRIRARWRRTQRPATTPSQRERRTTGSGQCQSRP